MINTSQPFKSKMTDRIDEIIRAKRPTREQPIDSIQVAQELGIEIDSLSRKSVVAYLNSLVGKKLLDAYGSDSAMSLMPRIYYIKHPHQQSYWENLNQWKN